MTETKTTKAEREDRRVLAAQAREAEFARREAADVEALKVMDEDQIAAAKWCRLPPSEWLYWSKRR